MSDYTITTDFGAKDSLPSGNAAKIIKGSEFTTEFTNIKTAVNTKADTTGDTFTGAVTFDAAVTLNADVTFDTNTLFVDVSEDKVGIGTTTPDSKLDVAGVIKAGETQAVQGATGLAIKYIDGHFINTFGSMYSSGDSLIGYGVESSKTQANTFISTAANSSFARGALTVDGELKFFNAASTTTAVGSEVTMTERMRINSSGNVGIGTSSPTGDLTIGRNGNASGGNIMLGSATNNTNKYGVITSQSYNSSTDTEGFATIATQGISDTNLVTIGGGIGEVDSATQVRLYTSSATGTRTGTERMRIDSSGNVLVGTTDQYAFNGGFSVKTGTVPYINVGHASSVASGNYYAAFRHGTNTIGTITQNGTTGILYNTSSDERLKENITDSTDAGSKVDAIQIRQYDWKADGSHQDYGVIAQELVEVAPEAVHQPVDEEAMMGVDYSKLVPMLIKEVQTLRNRVAQLENN